MSDQGRVDVVIDELVLDGVDPAAVSAVVRAIEDALVVAPRIGADNVAAVVSDAVTHALRPKGDR